jgi:hypothetical protein
MCTVKPRIGIDRIVSEMNVRFGGEKRCKISFQLKKIMLYFLMNSGNLGKIGLNALGIRTIEQKKMSPYNVPIIILILCWTPTCPILQSVGYIHSIFTNRPIYNLVYRMIMKCVFCGKWSVIFAEYIAQYSCIEKQWHVRNESVRCKCTGLSV